MTGRLGLAGVLDADRRHARGGLRERDQLVPRSRHRRADDPDAPPSAAGPRGRARSARWCSGSCWVSISIALMACFVNLVAAFLTLLAIAFYVVVYTIMLKRTTPQNIVIGGAAGALPPVIGWAAVTGDVGVAGAAAVRARLLLDAAALLGAGAADPRGLRGGRRAHAPGRQGRARDDPPDRRCTRSCWSRSRWSSWRSRAWADLPRRGGRARRRVPVAGVGLWRQGDVARRLDRAGDPPVQATRSST